MLARCERGFKRRANAIDCLHRDGSLVVARGLQVDGASKASYLGVGAGPPRKCNDGLDLTAALICLTSSLLA